MSGIGRVGSFATDTPLAQNFVGQALTDTENQGFRYRKERRDIADAKKKEEEDKNKVIAEDFDSFNKELVPTITGYSSIDDPINMFAMDAKQKGVEWIRQKNQERDPYKKAEIQSKVNKLTQSFKLANQYSKLLNDKKAELEKGIKEGKYNERDLDAVTEMAKSIDSGKYDMRFDENGVPRMTIYKVDEAGVPIGVLEKNISLGDLINRITPFQKPTYDIKGGIAEQIKSQIELDKSKVQNGFVTTTVEQRNKRVDEALRNKAKEIASMPSEAYELWQKMGNPAKRTFTDADKQQIANYVENDLKSRYPTLYEKDIDQSGALNARKFAKKLEEEKALLGTEATVSKNIYYDSKGNRYIPKQNEDVSPEALKRRGIVKVQDGSKLFPIDNVTLARKQGKEEKAKGIIVAPGGKMYLEVEEVGSEGRSRTDFNLTESGKKKLQKKDAKTPINKFYETLSPEDFVSENVSEKVTRKKLLDFGKDGEEIGRYAKAMKGFGFEGADDLKNYYIELAGGDEFIVTPDERKQVKPKSDAIQFDSEGNIIIN